MHKILFFVFILIFLYSCQEKINNLPPNIILIVSDDQGWGDLSFNGNSNLSTPNIDRLAETGISFGNFFVCPVCSPTRAELLTGRYYPRGGVYSTSAGGERLDLDETTIAEYFKQAGYSTAAYGKWHNGMQPPYHPNARGFDDFYGFCSGHWGNYFSPVLEHNGEIVKGDGFIIDDLTNHAIDFISQHQDSPFFLYLPYNTPHSPMQVPDKYWDRFKEKELEMYYQGQEPEDTTFTKAALAMCENIDWNVGRITHFIDSLGIAENTIVIYLSDNGPNGWRWNGGMRGRKGSTDEGGVRSPLFINWKGKVKPGDITGISGAIDLLPTLAGLAGIDMKPEKQLDGVDLSAQILGAQKQSFSERLIFSHWGNRTSVRSQDFRLDYQDRLYNIVADRGQKEDVSAKFPDVKKMMETAKSEWERDVLAELPAQDNRPVPVGHPDYDFTQLPARDALCHGNVKRSNKYPNCSYMTNWVSSNDSITWDVEVLAEGDFEATIYYSCPANDIGSEVDLSFKGEKLRTHIFEAHDPSLEGMENDRSPRIESYVKQFKPLIMGNIHLDQGKGLLLLQAPRIAGEQAMDFRMLILKRTGS